MAGKKKVLILCTGNSARSQMAEGLLRHFSEEEGGAAFEVFSAGVKASFVRPEAIHHATLATACGTDSLKQRVKRVPV